MSKGKALVLGGNRFFGRHLTLALLKEGYEVTLLNRGRFDDHLGSAVQRIKADRRDEALLKELLHDTSWDMVFDQICFTANEARALCELMVGKTKRLVFTSSQSVYSYGLQLPESSFDPYNYKYVNEVTPEEDYSEAKRQCEAIFADYLSLNPLMVRMPFVVGTDDYSGRLTWHIERCIQKKPIYFPNSEARLGFIRSDMAGSMLLSLAQGNLTGPINCACHGDMSLSQLMTLVENVTGQRCTPAIEASSENHSPYGIEKDWTMSLSKLISTGANLPKLGNWMPQLVQELAKTSS